MTSLTTTRGGSSATCATVWSCLVPARHTVDHHARVSRASAPLLLRAPVPPHSPHPPWPDRPAFHGDATRSHVRLLVRLAPAGELMMTLLCLIFAPLEMIAESLRPIVMSHCCRVFWSFAFSVAFFVWPLVWCISVAPRSHPRRSTRSRLAPNSSTHRTQTASLPLLGVACAWVACDVLPASLLLVPLFISSASFSNRAVGGSETTQPIKARSVSTETTMRTWLGGLFEALRSHPRSITLSPGG